MLRVHLFLFCAFLLCSLHSQNELAASYSQGNYSDCLAACHQQLEQNARDSVALYYQGLCYLQQENYPDALAGLRAAEAANFPAVASCRAQQARCLAGLEQPDEALTILQEIVGQGFANYRPFLTPEFDRLKDQAEYGALRDTVHRRAYPCFYDANYTHFDFWLGEWEVFVGATKVGDNLITKQEGGCAILEQYTTARDYVGQSLNFYDPADGLWKQFWTDKTQGLTKYVESERQPGYLQFLSQADSTPANAGTLRMTFKLNDDGSVRQHIEQQSTEDDPWQTVFDGRYVRK